MYLQDKCMEQVFLKFILQVLLSMCYVLNVGNAKLLSLLIAEHQSPTRLQLSNSYSKLKNRAFPEVVQYYLSSKFIFRTVQIKTNHAKLRHENDLSVKSICKIKMNCCILVGTLYSQKEDYFRNWLEKSNIELKHLNITILSTYAKNSSNSRYIQPIGMYYFNNFSAIKNYLMTTCRYVVVDHTLSAGTFFNSVLNQHFTMLRNTETSVK